MQDQSVESEETLRESGSRGDGLYRQRVSALADLSVAERNLFGDQFRGMEVQRRRQFPPVQADAERTVIFGQREQMPSSRASASTADSNSSVSVEPAGALCQKSCVFWLHSPLVRYWQ